MSSSSSTETECLELQSEEIESLEAIYGDDFTDCGEGFVPGYPDRPCRCLKIVTSLSSNSAKQVALSISLPRDYPLVSGPYVGISAPGGWLSNAKCALIAQNLMDGGHFEPGDLGTVYQWVSLVSDETAFTEVGIKASEENGNDKPVVPVSKSAATAAKAQGGRLSKEVMKLYNIVEGEAVTDRKSKFVAHAAVVHTREEVKEVMDVLLEDSKIAIATHNIMAYRILMEDGTIDEQRFDDGEHGAGDKLLFLLDQRGECETMVCVSRWWGGILLGPDRFKHINTRAAEALDSPEMAKLRTIPLQPHSRKKK